MMYPYSVSVYVFPCTLIPIFWSKFCIFMLVIIKINSLSLLNSGELQFSGNKTPVYVGFSRIITCEWTGSENITKLEWYLVGLEGLGLGMKLSDTMIALITGRVTDISWNGRMYVCKATLTNGTIVQRTFSLWVKGHYFYIRKYYDVLGM